MNRRLKGVMLIVSGGFSQLSSAIKVIFPDTDYPLCVIHMEKDVKRDMNREDANIFCEELGIIKKVNDFKKVLLRFEWVYERFEKKYKMVSSKKWNYLHFLVYPLN
ncbi:MAG: transposase [Deltaproteobacteria bacterium]|nr:transposase [Deltaproteobacteria bacterium]